MLPFLQLNPKPENTGCCDRSMMLEFAIESNCGKAAVAAMSPLPDVAAGTATATGLAEGAVALAAPVAAA